MVHFVMPALQSVCVLIHATVVQVVEEGGVGMANVSKTLALDRLGKRLPFGMVPLTASCIHQQP